MKIRKFIGCMAIFLAGMAASAILIYGNGDIPEARADQYSCIRTDLNAQGMTGNVPDAEFTITYDWPQCLKNLGYKMQRAYIRGDQVAVKYSKSAN